MVAFVGTLASSIEVTEVPTGLIPVARSVRVSTRTLGVGKFLGDLSALGTLTDLLPHDMPAAAFTGVTSTTYFDLFYNRIHINPGELSMGNVLSTQVRTVEVFNAFPIPKAVTALVGFETEGVAVNPPAAMPFNIPAYSSVFYSFSITVEGPAVINALFQWTIGGIDYTLTVTGQRVVVFPYQPNWAEGIVERLEWMTNIFTANDGSEKRTSLRTLPRQSFELSYLVWLDKWSGVKNFLYGWQDKLAAIPLWQDRRTLTASAAAGTSTLFFDTTKSAHTVGQAAVLYVNPFKFETVEIAAINATSITLLSPLSGNWEQGQAIFPAAFARVRSAIPMSAANEGIAAFKLTWHVDPVEGKPWLPTAGAPATYLGREVLQTVPNWRDGLEDVSEFDTPLLDFDTGAINPTPGRAFFRQKRAHLWFLKDRTAIENFRAFLKRRAGRRVSFYAPSFRRDLELIGPIVPGSNTILVKDNFDSFVRGKVTHRYIEILVNNGTKLRYELNDSQSNGDGTMNLSVVAPFVVSYTPSQVIRISYLPLSRLAEDSVEIKWHAPNVAEASTVHTEVAL